MKMEESNIFIEQHASESSSENIMKVHEEMGIKFEVERIETSEKPPGIPAIEITFRNSGLANKYKTSIEKFLNTLLTEEEKKTVSFRIFEENVKHAASSFCIDTASVNGNLISTSDDVPHYSAMFSEVLQFSLDKDVEIIDLEMEEGTPNVQATTCFNCLGCHHMRECPEKVDRARVMRNRKKLAVSLQNNTRYHEDEKQKKSGGQAGKISSSLREALGLKPHQLPIYIYNMRVIGYPPAWLKEAEVETSGLNVYDSEGNVVADVESSVNEFAQQYNSDKFIEYPGFNCPPPDEIVDECNMYRMPPLQLHQQLSEAVKQFGKPSPVESYKKRKSGNSGSESKRAKNAGTAIMAWEASMPRCLQEQETLLAWDSESSQNEDSKGATETPISSPAVTEDSADAFGNFENSFDRNSLPTNNGISYCKTPQSSSSLTSTPGSALVDRGNPFQKLPDLVNFSQGITEHLPYENLPGAVGTFDKMRNVLNNVKQKLTYEEN